MLILRVIQLKLRVKIFLGLSLCLSAVMIIVSIIRVASIGIPHTEATDIVWQVFWHWVECCIAITVVSLAAFRAYFVEKSKRKRSREIKKWYSGIKAAMIGKSSSRTRRPLPPLPEIPGATLTGMGIFINASGQKMAGSVGGDREAQGGVRPTARERLEEQAIHIREDVSVDFPVGVPTACSILILISSSIFQW